MGILIPQPYHPPMIESPQGFLATVLGLAAAFPLLAARWKARLFDFLPPIVAAYAVTMLLAVGGLWRQSEAVAATRSQLLMSLVPALVFLLLVPCDLRAVARVGPRLLLAFAVATLTILIGFVAAWLVWRAWLPANAWQVLACVAGGWVGGTANLVAVAGGLEASADAVGLAVVTDTVCYFCWILVLFSAAPLAAAFNRWSGGELPQIEVNSALLPATIPGAATLVHHVAWLGAGLVVGQAAAALARLLPASDFLSTSSWTILIATAAGMAVAQTPLRTLPGSAAMASAVLFVVVVTLATQATLAGLSSAPVFVAAGFTVLAIHALSMLAAARLLRLDLASCSVASLANIGGVGSAPLMAALHAPALAPVAVLLALLGYLIGLPAGLTVAALLQRLGPSLAPAAVVMVACLGGPAAASDTATDRRTPEFWVSQCPDADRVLLDAASVTAFNARVSELDPTVRDLAGLPKRLPRAEVLALITAASPPAAQKLFTSDAAAVTADDQAGWQTARNLDAIPPQVAPRFGLVVRRAAIRSLPTQTRVHSTETETDLDRFLETGLFPGTPVAVLHHSTDAAWHFVLSPTYAGWIAADSIATGSRTEVLDYVARGTRVVTGSEVRTVFTPDLPGLSRLVLDMGVVLPDRSDWPHRQPVNGQVPLAAHVVELPTRSPAGSLAIMPALIPFAADTHTGPLPVTRANLIRQAGKFLGDRYGWGHDFDGRDCSGLVGEAYRSLGIVLPRNTADHVRSPALDRTPIPADLDRERRLAAIAALAPGDLIYAPRHVMMVIGHAPDTWVIHATHGGWDGPSINGVVIMPLAEVGSAKGPIIDTVTNLIRVLPR